MLVNGHLNEMIFLYTIEKYKNFGEKFLIFIWKILFHWRFDLLVNLFAPLLTFFLAPQTILLDRPLLNMKKSKFNFRNFFFRSFIGESVS